MLVQAVLGLVTSASGFTGTTRGWMWLQHTLGTPSHEGGFAEAAATHQEAQSCSRSRDLLHFWFVGQKPSQALAALLRGLGAETPTLPCSACAWLSVPGSGAVPEGMPHANLRSASPLQPTPRVRPPAPSPPSPLVPSCCP